MVLTWLYRKLPLEIRKKVSFAQYKDLISNTNKKVVDLVVEGERVRLGQLGVLHVEVRERKYNKPTVNILATKKRKAYLESQGILPYKAIKDKDGKIIGDNGGEKFFVYYTDDWYAGVQIGKSRLIYVPATDDGNSPIIYKFDSHRNVKRHLSESIQKNPNLKHRYENLSIGKVRH